MSGTGNDFIIMDAVKGMNLKQLAARVCDRTKGIGADGLLILDKSTKADYKMRIINADGSEAEMCGNGARCMIAYIALHKKIKKKFMTLETLAGLIRGEVKGNVVSIRLSDPVDYQPDIPLKVKERSIHVSYIDTGVPHTIVYVDDLNRINVQQIGQAIRCHERFQPRGTNVNFVEQVDTKLINVRTYERGVEDETKACGTGSVASAIITYLKANPAVDTKERAKMKVHTNGQDLLEVTFDITEKKVSNVWLKGNVLLIAEGEYYLS